MKSVVIVLGLLFGTVATSLSADDLKNEKLLNLLDRIASANRPRPFGTRRFYSVNDKNNIVEIKFRRVKLEPGDLKVIAELDDLESLDLSETNVADAELVHLQKLGKLRSLNLFQTKISNSGLSHLRMMVQLEELNVGRTRINDESLKVCATLTNLKRLTLHGCKLDGSGLKHLVELSKLEVIKVGDTQVSDSCIPVLQKIKSLKGIQLDETNVTAKSLGELASSPNLKWMASSITTVDELIKRMEAGDFQRVDDMTTVGLIIPARKAFKRIGVAELAKNAKDKKLNRQRFKVELRWEEDGKKPVKFHATVAVDRGTVQVHEMGIDDLK